MRIFRATISAASLALLIVQLAIVSAAALTYTWQRHSYPRVWTRAYGYDPHLPLRGRYLSLQVAVDGCHSTLPSSKQALFMRDYAGAVKPGPYSLKPSGASESFSARLLVENNTLLAVYIQNEEQRPLGQAVYAASGKSCTEMRLGDPVDFYIDDNAPNLLPLNPDQELWIELTVPPLGPPRPIQLALKSGTAWTPFVSP